MLDFLRKNASGPFGFALIILLVLAFSVWGIGDIFRNYDSGIIARIGDREINSQEYLFRYNREINRISNELERFISNEEARDSGLDIQVLSNLLVEKSINSSADVMKLRPSDSSLKERIKNTSAFRNAFNQFDKNVFIQVLRQNGITEDLFFKMERDTIVQSQIYRALFENINISQEFSNLIYRFQNENRSVDYVILSFNDKDASNIEINSEELVSYYNKNLENYKTEASRSFTIIQLLKSDLASDINVEEKFLEELYEINIDNYQTPEKRSYYLIPYNSIEEANIALNNYSDGFDIDLILSQRGLSIDDVIQSQLAFDEGLNEEISEVVFNIEKNKLFGPIQGPFGPTLIYVSEIYPSFKKDFSEVRSQIEQNYKLEKSQDKVYELYNIIEDQRAEGLTLEEIAETNNIKISSYSSINILGYNFNNFDLSEDLKSTIIENVFQSDLDYGMDPIEDSDGNIVFLRIDNIEKEKQREFESVKEIVKSDILDMKQKIMLDSLSKNYLNDIKGNVKTLEKIADDLDVAILKKYNLSRYSFDEVFSKSAVNEIFKTNLNQPFLSNVGIGNSIIIGVVTEISVKQQDEERIVEINQQNEGELKNELLFILSEELQKELTSEVYPERLDFLFETINAKGSF
tara:strand:- start:657 stop:2561 length:1905 start_codon:yes stop_codon:yes gene_type:complete